MLLKIENSHEAISKEFRDLKARSKVGMKHFHFKMTGVWYVWVSTGYKELANCQFRFGGFKGLVEIINQQANK